MRVSVYALMATALVAGCAAEPVQRGTGDLGLVVERAAGSVLLIETSGRSVLGRIDGLGDLSHASIVYSRDGRYGYVFGRDGGLSKVDLLAARIVARIVQAGNAIGGAISQDGRLIAAANYEPGGVRLFDAATLEPLAEIPATWGDGKQRAKVVGIVDAPGNLFVWSLFEAGEIWIADATDPRKPVVTRLKNAGRQPYDALVTPDGRHYIAGLFGEDGLALVDLWEREPRVRRILAGYGRGQEPLPV
jgi:protein NirF